MRSNNDGFSLSLHQNYAIDNLALLIRHMSYLHHFFLFISKKDFLLQGIQLAASFTGYFSFYFFCLFGTLFFGIGFFLLQASSRSSI